MGKRRLTGLLESTLQSIFDYCDYNFSYGDMFFHKKDQEINHNGEPIGYVSFCVEVVYNKSGEASLKLIEATVKTILSENNIERPNVTKLLNQLL